MSDESSEETPKARESVSPGGFVDNFTWEKGHAVTYGMFLLFVAAMASSVYVLAGFVSIALWALGVRGSPFRYTQSGDPKACHDDERGDLKPHKKIFREIRHKPHYFIGGGAVGDVCGRVGYWLLHGTQPDHWEHLPEVVGGLFGVVV